MTARPDRGLPLRSRNILLALVVEQALGAVLTAVGDPAAGSGAALLRLLLITVHELVGAGLLLAAVVLLGAARVQPGGRGPATVGAAGITAAFAGGVLTAATGSDRGWVLLMSLGFAVAVGAYAVLAARAHAAG